MGAWGVEGCRGDGCGGMGVEGCIGTLRCAGHGGAQRLPIAAIF